MVLDRQTDGQTDGHSEKRNAASLRKIAAVSSLCNITNTTVSDKQQTTSRRLGFMLLNNTLMNYPLMVTRARMSKLGKLPRVLHNQSLSLCKQE